MKNYLDYAAYMYYEGTPIISDAEFDKLADKYNYETVGSRVDNGVKHAYRMYSLQKCYTDEPLIELNGRTVKTLKFDGAAISLLYIEGELRLALTRGDGIKGQDITDKMKYLVPNNIPYKNVLQIGGEVVAPSSIENARNYAAGALNLKNIEEFKSRDIIFIAYSINPMLTPKYTQDMATLVNWGFETVVTHGEKYMESHPIDGIVYRLNDNDDYRSAGFTSKHPKGAFALKTRQDGVVTQLQDVKWQVGRSGVVSPVAILKPIKIGGATISKATLHNKKYIRELNLEIGCDVEIIRSGEIIPRVVRRV